MAGDRIATEEYVDGEVAGVTGSVSSVNTQTGAVVLTATDVGADASGAAAAAQAASQPVDSDLTAIAALTTTSYGRALLALADAAAGRTALGLGTAATHATGDYDAAGAAAAAQAASQPLDSDLTAIAALTTTSFGRSVLAAADAAALRTLAATVIGTNVQAWDADLDSLAAVGLTAAGLALLDDANAAAQRTTLGLGNVDNTTDTGKPVSTAQQTALDLKAPLASPAFTGTPTGITKSHVGLGSVDNTADAAKPVSTAQQTALDLKAPLASPTFTGTVVLPAQTVTRAMEVNQAANSFRGNNTGSAATGLDLTVAQAKTLLALVKADVGLGNVDNTADASKTFTESQITSLTSDLALKAPIASPTFTGTVTLPFLLQTDGTATHGRVEIQTLGVATQGFGGYDNTADTLPNWYVGRISGLYANVGVYLAGANGAADVNFSRTGAAAAQIVGQLTIVTGLTMANAKDIVLNTSTGTKIGTATSQKLGFWNVTPVIQPAGANQAAVGTTAPAGGTGAAAGGWSTAGNRDTAITTINSCVTLVNQLRSDLVAAGLIKGAA